MRKIRYSAGMKAAVILLEELFSVLLVICIILVSTLMGKSMLDIGSLKSKSFTDSGYYENLFLKSVTEVLDYIEYQERFETDGVYNPEKTVNVMAYRNQEALTANNRIPIKNSDLFRYYLIDLENWSKNLVLVEQVVESSLYLTQDGTIHQQQKVYIDGSTVKESDTVVQKVKDMDPSLQQLVIANVQYFYGGSYNWDNYLTVNGNPPNQTVYADIPDSSQDMKDNAAQDETDGGEDNAGSSTATSSDAAQMDEIIQKIRDGKLFDLGREELAAVLTELDLVNTVCEERVTVPQEKYMTVDETTIQKEFLSEHITLQEMTDAYDSLIYTLENIGTEINNYRQLVNKYQRGGSNLQYWIYVENQNRYYTNMPEAESRDNFTDYGKELGSYFYYNKNNIVLNTNVGGMEDAFYNVLDVRNGGQNSVIFIGVDTTFPHEDAFYEGKQDYSLLQPWGTASLVFCVISVLGCFLCFVYLSLAAGRNSEDPNVRLNWFDKIKTELMMVGFVAVCAGAVVIFRALSDMFRDSDMAGMMIMAGGLTFTLVGLFMIFYMSFVRRIKAGIMWSGSLLFWIGSGIQKVVRNWKPSVRILLAFAGHVVLTLFMAAIALTWNDRPWVVVVVLLAYLLLYGAEALLFLREGVQRNVIMDSIKRISGGDLEYEIDTEELKGDNKAMGEAINTISEGLYHAVDGSMKNERLKADLITNVSHDIKTPLTSIINYVDLLKREHLENERAKGYIRVLDAKSQRLKQLTEDLVEASKISSGNITLQMSRLDLVELVYQTAGEFNERFEARGLTAVTKLPKEPVVIMADGRRIWRVIDNLYNNVAKYAMENTRVYVDMEVTGSQVAFSIKNISEQALNIDASELTERFIRGDVSRSTEGSGLGLSIAQNLTTLMGGTFNIYLDGDLFKVTVTFPLAKDEEKSGTEEKSRP